MKNKGFTLVELAIVLVIIGLLIGGILAAQSMVDTSKVMKTGKQLGEFDAAVGSFSARYNGQLPGDSKALGGDGDGAIEGLNANTAFDSYLTAFACEMGTFWSQAMPDKFVSAGGCNVLNTMVLDGPNKTVPRAAIGHPDSVFIASANGTNDLVASPLEHYYTINVSSQNRVTGGAYLRLGRTSNTENNRALKPMELYSLDKKFDDGAANSGYIRAGSYAFSWGAPNAAVAFANCSTGGPAYVLANNSYECTPFFRMGMNSGDLK